MPKINVLRKVNLDGTGWRMLPVLKEGTRLDWSKVVQAGAPVVAASGTFYFE